ncbi:DUF2630 family protein [Streptomyces griseoincarnatus]
MEENQKILHRITEMAQEERSLRDSLGAGKGGSDAERVRLGLLERELDQCWDLLRQRKARAEFGQNPDDAHVRPQSIVERYAS